MSNVIDSLGRIKVTTSGASGGNIWPKPNKLMIGAVEYSSLALAIAAAASGDTIYAGVGTFTCDNQTLPSGVNLCGGDRDATIFTSSTQITTLTAAGSNYIANVTITNTASSASTCIALNVSGVIELFNILTNATDSSGNGSYSLYLGTGSSGKVYSSQVNGAFYGIVSFTTNTITIFNMDVDTSSYGLSSAGNGTVRIMDTHFANGQPDPANITDVTGWYFDAAADVIFFNNAGMSGEVWLHKAAGLRLKELDFAHAVTNAAASGDTIKLFGGTFSVINNTITIAKSLTVQGDGPEATILTNSKSNGTALDIDADNVTVVFKDITLRNTGGGTASTVIFSNNSGVTVVLDNAVVEISSGAGTTSRGLWIEAGTWILRNGSKIVITSGTNKYAIYNDSGAATVTIGAGCEVGGATQDVYGDQAGSTLTINGTLTNNLISWAGTLQGRWLNANGVQYAPESNDTFSPLTFRPGYIIVPSVSSNNLTVALKTLDSNDASASSPIVVRIGDAVRTITAALSTTKNAGTNWCNSGGAELATNAVDYFVYLIQETGGSAGTKIGFSRIPWATTMNDFSATSTNETYIAGSYTNKNASDVVTVIGRFSATLSAGASYNWSSPGTVINYPIFESQWLTYVPAVTAFSGTITTVGATDGKYQVSGRDIFFFHSATITANGTGAVAVVITIPFTNSMFSLCVGRENAVVGFMIQGSAAAAANNVTWQKYDGTYPGGNGYQIAGGIGTIRLV